jgi:hypothetical protein
VRTSELVVHRIDGDGGLGLALLVGDLPDELRQTVDGERRAALGVTLALDVAVPLLSREKLEVLERVLPPLR